MNDTKYKNIGELLKSYNKNDKLVVETVTGEKIECKNVFIVGINDTPTIHTTAEKWAGKGCSTDVFDNMFIKITLTKDISKRQNREVMKIVITNKDGDNFLIDLYVSHFIKDVAPYSSFINGVADGEFLLTKEVSSRSIKITTRSNYINHLFIDETQLTKVTKTTLEKGSLYKLKNGRDSIIFLGFNNKKAVFLSTEYGYHDVPVFSSNTVNNISKNLSKGRYGFDKIDVNCKINTDSSDTYTVSGYSHHRGYYNSSSNVDYTHNIISYNMKLFIYGDYNDSLTCKVTINSVYINDIMFQSFSLKNSVNFQAVEVVKSVLSDDECDVFMDICFNNEELDIIKNVSINSPKQNVYDVEVDITDNKFFHLYALKNN